MVLGIVRTGVISGRRQTGETKLGGRVGWGEWGGRSCGRTSHDYFVNCVVASRIFSL